MKTLWRCEISHNFRVEIISNNAAYIRVTLESLKLPDFANKDYNFLD